ncbi:type II secretion system GspH family protein [Alphaproteobacteria bacterium]|nr:type II secretion system GspH family protein [Alphaproteobacteria bacterium]
MSKSLKHKTHNPESGFTLVEMLMVVIISSILLTGLILIYDQYRKKIMDITTKENVATISGQLALFRALDSRGSYPCPADASLSIEDPNFGRQFDNDDYDDDTFGQCDVALMGLDFAAVVAGNTSCNRGVCLGLGARDIDLDQVPATPNQAGLSAADNNKTFILIGAVPVRALKEISPNLPLEAALDGYGNKLTYAVTLNQVGGNQGASEYEYKFDQGSIGAVDEFDNYTAGMINAAGEPDAHYVIVSHGEDGKGAYNAQGSLIAPCGTVAEALDNENCEGDGIFMKALGYSLANDTQFYDDYTYFSKIATERLWDYIYIDNAGPGTQRTDDIQSLNIGNVGIGTSTPRATLEVSSGADDCVPNDPDSTSTGTCGIIRAHNNIYATEICDKSDNLANIAAGNTPINCFRIDLFTQGMTGAGEKRCPPGQIMNGFLNNLNNGTDLNCVNLSPITSLVPKDCGSGYWVAGIDTDGNIICTDELDDLIPDD